MNLFKNTFASISRRIPSNNSKLKSLFVIFLTICSLDVLAQTFQPAVSTETQYPDATMSPPTLNLDKRYTKFLSNFSYPGTGVLSGSTIELSGWSTDNDGGFSYGTATSGVYTGIGSMAIPHAREVQIGYLEFTGGQSYIVASYYDVAEQLYGYDLYSWDFTTNIVSKLYTYHFVDPNFAIPAYTPTSLYLPVVGLTTPPPGGYPAPTKPSMVYNRISMDIKRTANKIAIVFTDSTTGSMYTAMGVIGMDTIIFSSNLPLSPETPAVSLSTTYPAIGTPYYHFPYPGAYTGGPTIFTYFDATTGIYAQYDATTNLYQYSYYPISRGIYITEYDPVAGTVNQLSSITSQLPYSPLIRLKAVSTVTTPCVNPYYKQYWPDVAFSEDNPTFIFYAPELNDLYVSDYGYTFNDFYNYSGTAISPLSCYTGITDFELESNNTVDSRPISSDYIYGSLAWPHESRIESLPLTIYNPEIRAKLDVPDLSSSNWALTFAYRPASYYKFSYSLGYPPGLYLVHDMPEIGKNNIYVRSNYIQSILTNGSLGNTAINNDKNVAPTITYKPLSNNVSVAWASERAGVANGTTWGYVATEFNTTTLSLVSALDYLLLSTNPSYDCGNYPLVALSKQTVFQSALYSAYAQEDATGTYSIDHQNHPWISTSNWRKTNAALQTTTISVGPNPFTSFLHVQSAELLEVVLMDITGRSLAHYNGSAAEINVQLDAKVGQLIPGSYMLNTKTASGVQNVFNVVKQ